MGTEPDLAERDKRYKRIREAMHNAGLDGLLVAGKGHGWTGRGYIRYLTDFHMWGHDALLLIPLEDEPVMTINSHGVASMVARGGWVQDVRGSCNVCPHTPPMIDAMKEKGITKGKIGIAGLNFILPAGAYQLLREKFPGIEFVDSDEMLDRIRMVKSPLEIQQNRELWDLSKAAMERFVEVLEPGKSKMELASEAAKVAIRHGARDMIIFLEEHGVGGPPRDIPVKCDDIVNYHMEICGPSGHWSEITVICAYRDINDRELKLMETELRAKEAIHEIAKPGSRLSEFAAILESCYKEDGWEWGPPREGLDFHGQGMDGVERPVFAEPKEWGQDYDWELQAGTVINYHPRRTIKPGMRGTGINEDIVITPQGADRLGGDWELRWRNMKK